MMGLKIGQTEKLNSSFILTAIFYRWDRKFILQIYEYMIIFQNAKVWAFLEKIVSPMLRISSFLELISAFDTESILTRPLWNFRKSSIFLYFPKPLKINFFPQIFGIPTIFYLLPSWNIPLTASGYGSFLEKPIWAKQTFSQQLLIKLRNFLETFKNQTTSDKY